MNIQEALGILGLSPGASKDEVSKAFREKAKVYHPDQNKEPDAEDKFKQINEARQVLTNEGTTPNMVFGGSSYFRVNNFNHSFSTIFGADINEQFSTKHHKKVSISFEESVLGGTVSVPMTWFEKCSLCKGTGKRVLSCSECSGTGILNCNIQSNVSINIPCNMCKGSGFKITFDTCKECSGTGKKERSETIDVTIPPGSDSKSVIPTGIRTWKGGFYNKIYLDLDIVPNKSNMVLDGVNVISPLRLTLLEALEGVEKKVKTVKGEKKLVIKPRVRNGDKIRVAGFGVPPSGAHIFMLNVEYPDDTSELVNVLKKEKNNGF